MSTQKMKQLKVPLKISEKVKVGNDQEMPQSERTSHSNKKKGGKN